MILSYRDGKTERFAKGEFVKAFQGFEDQAAEAAVDPERGTHSILCAPSRAIGSKGSREIGRDSIPFGSTSNGGFASSGRTVRPDRATSRSRTIIEERRSGHVHASRSSRRNSQGRIGRLGRYADRVLAADRRAADRVGQIIAGKRAVTGDTALRFGHWFGTEPQLAELAKRLRYPPCHGKSGAGNCQAAGAAKGTPPRAPRKTRRAAYSHGAGDARDQSRGPARFSGTAGEGPANSRPLRPTVRSTT